MLGRMIKDCANRTDEEHTMMRVVASACYLADREQPIRHNGSAKTPDVAR